MKYLKKFNTEADVQMFVRPNVVLVADTGNVFYNAAPPNGIYIQHIDGNLHTEADWTNGGFSNDEANGVAVITDNARFVIAKNDLGEIVWSSDTSTLVDGILTVTNKTTALTDFAGHNNTQLMLATDTSGAGYSCANYTFPNGQKGYLPALGELNEAYANGNASKINSLMTKIGGSKFSASYWSSTQHSADKAWMKYFNYSTINYFGKSTDIYVRAFTVLTL